MFEATLLRGKKVKIKNNPSPGVIQTHDLLVTSHVLYFCATAPAQLRQLLQELAANHEQVGHVPHLKEGYAKKDLLGTPEIKV